MVTRELLSTDLRSLLARALFGGEPLPDTLFVGLSSEAAPATLRELESGEVEGGDGYTRARVHAGQWIIEQQNGRIVVNGVMASFMNMGDARWPAVRSFFISTSPVSGAGNLIAHGSIPNGERVLAPGDMLRVEPEIRWLAD